MAILPIRLHPDPVLRERAPEVSAVDDSVRKLVQDMTETMYDAPGLGLAAPQVGVQRRVLVYDAGDELHALINPAITAREGEVVEDEGCLSIPGLQFPVARAQRISVVALDALGGRVSYDAADMEARVIQHEVDHLDGLLFLDRLAPEHRREAMRILRERELEGDFHPARRPAAAL
jgi:peptide deformylase